MDQPEKIGRYKIESELGRGGMAVVYLARDPLIDRQIALKLMPSLPALVDTQFRPRFER
jgi:serine/threonine protein kinase